MTDKPSCETCDIWKQRFAGTWHKCPMHHYPASVLEREFKDVINHYGCLSHPQARVYLMKEVLEELEDRKRMLDGFEPDIGSENYIEAKTIGKAIALIRNGVEK